MTDLPLVTIVTPSFNQGAFIRATIASVLSQGYPHVEYMVIDGGSTDDTINILQSYGERFFWVSEPDNGQSHAINKGFRRAKGEILAWLNSDDVLLPGAIAESVAVFRAHSEADLVYGDGQLIDETGNVIFDRLASKPFSITALLAAFTAVVQPSAFFRRQVLERTGYLNENFHYIMDLDLWLRIALVGTGIYAPGIRSQFRFHTRSKSVAVDTRFWAERRQLLDSFFAQPVLPDEALAAKREAYAHCELYWGEKLLLEGNPREARPHLWYAVRTHPHLRRRFLALLLLIDSQSGTRLASLARHVRDTVEGPTQHWKPPA